MNGTPTETATGVRVRRHVRIYQSVLAAVTALSVLAVAEPAWAQWPMCGCG